MGSRLSYNIHAQRLSEHDRLINHLKKIKPAAVLVMDGVGLAQEIKGLLPDTTVISRIYPDDDIHNRVSPEQWLNERAPQAAGGIYQYTTNEAGFSPNLIDWHIRLLEMAAQRRVPLVIGNMSVGTPAAEDWAAGKHLLELLDKHRDLFILGLHEYACGVITSGFLGGYPDNAGVAPNSGQTGRNLIAPDSWPTQAEAANMTMFHCGRFKFLVRYCNSVGIKPPRIILTEHGFDDVSDIKPWTSTLAMTSPYISIRGWKSAQEQWHKWYDPLGWTPQRAMFEQLTYADRTIYQNSPVEAQLVFCWGHTSDMWDQFDVADADEYQSLLENYAQEAPVAPTTTTQVGGSTFAAVGVQPVGVQPVGAQPTVAPVGMQPVGVRPQDTAATTVAPVGVQPVVEPVGQTASFTTPAQTEVQASAESVTPLDVVEIMSEDDVTVIAKGFRAAAESGIFSPVIAAGFARWADVLERYHADKWGVG